MRGRKETLRVFSPISQLILHSQLSTHSGVVAETRCACLANRPKPERCRQTPPISELRVVDTEDHRSRGTQRCPSQGSSSILPLEGFRRPILTVWRRGDVLFRPSSFCPVGRVARRQPAKLHYGGAIPSPDSISDWLSGAGWNELRDGFADAGLQLPDSHPLSRDCGEQLTNTVNRSIRSRTSVQSGLISRMAWRDSRGCDHFSFFESQALW